MRIAIGLSRRVAGLTRWNGLRARAEAVPNRNKHGLCRSVAGSLTEQERTPIATMSGCLLLAVRGIKLPRADPGDLLGEVLPVVAIKPAHPIVEKCLDAMRSVLMPGTNK